MKKSNTKPKKSNAAVLLNRLIESRIREILPNLIREEVDSQLKVLMESAAEFKETQLNTSVESKSTLSSITENIQIHSEPSNTIEHSAVDNGKKFNTGNPAIDDILRTTRGGIPQTTAGSINESYRNLMGQDVFTTGDMGKLPSVQEKQKVASVDSMVSANGKRISSDSEAGKLVNTVMNRDYSQLMKKILKK